MDSDNAQITLDQVLRQNNLIEETPIATPVVADFSTFSKATGQKKKFAKKYEFANTIELVPLFDLHIGLKGCDKEKLINTINYIMETPNAYTVLGGDILECATKTSVGLAMYEEEMGPKDQLLYAFNLLKPLAEAGKILDVVTGNHEMRLANFADMNPVEIMANLLSIPYSGYQGYSLIKVGNNVYKVGLFHGASGGCTPAGAVNAMRKQNVVTECDLYLSGHIHVKADGSDPYYKINEETGELEIRSKKYVVCGSFVEYWESYAEMKALPPAETGTVKITLEAEKWNIEPYIPKI